MNNAELEHFYEQITIKAVTDTVARLLTHPFSFHGDTGIHNYLYAQLLARGGDELDFNDPEGRFGYSTHLLQSEHYTCVNYGKTDPGRFDIALALPPVSDAIEDRFADKLRACFAFELGKNKDLEKIIEPSMVGRKIQDMDGKTDISKLYHELAHHDLRQGWAIEFYDSKVMNGASIISRTLEICKEIKFEDGKKLVVIFVGFSPDGEHYISSNDSGVQTLLIDELGKREIVAGSDLAVYSRKPAPPYRHGAWGSSEPSATVEEVFKDRADFANRIIKAGEMEEAGRASQYVNLSAGSKKNIAQLHPQENENGIGFVLPSRAKALTDTIYAEIRVSSLAGYFGTNKSWLDGAGKTFDKKGPAIAYLIPDEIGELPTEDPAWQEVARLLEHAKTSA